MSEKLTLWVAQGFGIGRIPVAPGTFGAALGLVWFALLLATGKVWALLLGCVIGFCLSVWLCDRAEKLLQKKDPGSVVLDEVTAMPVCFFSWIGIHLYRTGTMPSVGFFLSGIHAWTTVGVFVACRVFDIAKPWPVRQSQSLPGGWGITVDDFLAALYVNAVVLIVGLAWPHLV